MHNRISLKKIISCARAEYTKWLFNEKFVIVVALATFNYGFLIKPLLEHADTLSCNVNIFEPFIAIGNCNIMLMAMPTVFIVLISEYPRIDGNMAVYISRIGRLNWILGQMVTLVMSAATFILSVMLLSMLPVIGKCMFSNEWSDTVTQYALMFPEDAKSYTYLPANLYMQLTIGQAVLHTFAYLLLYFVLIGLLMLCFALAKRKPIGFAISAFLIAIGVGLCGFQSKLMWIFPAANAIPWLHFTKYLREEKQTLTTSYVYFVLMNLAVAIICVILGRKYDYDRIEQD